MPVSSKRYAAPLTIELRPSSRFLLFLSLTHVLALLALLLCRFDTTVTIVIAALVIAGFVYSLRRHVLLKAPMAITKLRWDEHDQWFVENRRQETTAVRLDVQSFRYAWLLVLNFVSEENKKYTVVLFRDSTDAVSFRRLKVRLLVNRQLNYEAEPL